ncbi:uncharacterized protein UMAG_02789 [Mycosarcoma maydis]|uniref:Uncharacterized protein n=1 Tax=Mycosarcoma maydis TaxID=5270 RepID=A0A0D1CSG0_MYCMD|nr:uncharacterized protein UMAG_02789 [Ustilago maydis 521]KIS69458.1 hypothetical protein UMAG_02789 [Ustilago maydis 521]|eukprot:XP_011389141.1 hypothetical protein UMAG_02789 [Ustilago maydis 521]
MTLVVKDERRVSSTGTVDEPSMAYGKASYDDHAAIDLGTRNEVNETVTERLQRLTRPMACTSDERHIMTKVDDCDVAVMSILRSVGARESAWRRFCQEESRIVNRE